MYPQRKLVQAIWNPDKSALDIEELIAVAEVLKIPSKKFTDAIEFSHDITVEIIMNLIVGDDWFENKGD